MNELHLIFGPMFAGKSTFLISKLRELYNLNINTDNIILINHIFDNRYNDKSYISTHNGDIVESIPLNKLADLFNNSLINIKTKNYILIDEGQFFTDLYPTVKQLLKLGKTIYISGLDGDYKQKPFTESGLLDLIPYATSITKLNARCSICNKTAPFTKRIINSNEKILIGGANDYQPVCINHLDDI